MIILHSLLCYYPSQAGGPANTIYWINKTLPSNKYKSKVVATTYGLKEVLLKKKFDINHEAFYFPILGVNYLLMSLKELKKSNILQFSSLFFWPTIPLLIVAVFRNTNIVISPRGELYDSALKQKYLKKRFWLFIVKLFQKKINFHTTNEYELKVIKNIFPKAKSTVLIPNFIELPKIINTIVENKITFLGRINPIKNIHLLIEAINIVNQYHPNTKLDIVGAARLNYEKEYLLELENKINTLSLEKVIKFRGHVEGNQKNELMASSKVLILPSKSENFGNVVLEALAQGTPVIASKGTPWEILEEYNAGFWVEPNKREIAKFIIKLLNFTDTEYKIMRENALQLCKNKFDIKTNIQVWENYYKNIKTNA